MPDPARWTAYRLALTIGPDHPRFTADDEIDIPVKTQASVFYGRDKPIATAPAKRGTMLIPARPTQIDRTRVV